MTTQQAAEHFGALVALSQAHKHGFKSLNMDNIGAICQLLYGRASTHLVAQHRILRRFAHRLRWQGMCVQLFHVESPLNPADPVSRALEHIEAKSIVLEAHARERLYHKLGPHICWGSVADRVKYVHCPILL